MIRISPMRSPILCSLLFAFAPLAGGMAAPFLEENFEYPAGPLHGQEGGTGFLSPWVVPEEVHAANIVNGGLSYQVEGGGLIHGGESALRVSGPVSSEHDSELFHRTMPALDASPFYLRYLISVPESAQFHQQRFAGFWLQNSRQWTFLTHRKDEPTSWGARIGDSETETIAPMFRKGETYLLVARFSKGSPGAQGRYNRIDLWINPSTGESETPHYTAVGKGVRELTSFSQLGFRVIGFTQERHGVMVDALALGQEWSDVVPHETEIAP